jgi:hypothetical protein
VSKADREKEVFEKFSMVAPFKVLPGSIESRPPPEPDILCQLDTFEYVAYELTELIDQEYMARLGLMFSTKQYLDSYWTTNLNPVDSRHFRDKYRDALINFEYCQESSLRDRKAVAAIAFSKLLDLPDNSEGEFFKSDPELMPNLKWIQICRVGIPEPIIDVASAGWLGDPTEPTIKKKFSKTYETEHPIELLAHINWGIMPLEDVWKASADNVSSMISGSPFRKFWVYDCTDNKIKYEFEK